MNEVYAAHVGEAPPARSTVEVAKLPRVRSSRSRPSRCSSPQWRRVGLGRDYVHSLGLDAYLVGGAVRDELLGGRPGARLRRPGRRHAELRRALEPHGTVEDLVVADQRVGVRLLPRDKAARRCSRPGSSSRRRASSARPARAGTTSRSSPTARSRSRRTWSGATSRSTRSRAGSRRGDPRPARRPRDLERGVLRTTGAASFRDDPLRIVRGLRFVSQLDVDPDDDTLRQMREWAPRIEHVSGERIGGGSPRTGWASSRSSCSARIRRRRCGSRGHRRPRAAAARVRAAIGYEQQSGFQHLPLDEHVFAVVQAAADAAAPLEVRLAALLHDLGKPEADRDGRAHEATGATIAGAVLRRLRYPTRLREYVVRLVREHPFRIPDEPTEIDARRFLARHGDRMAFDLLAHRDADLAGKTPPAGSVERTGRFRALVEQERSQPHRLADLAVDGTDLIALGYSEGPQLGQRLRTLLDEVVEEPAQRARAPARPATGAARDPLGAAGPYEVVFSTREAASARGRTRRSTSAA
jgi:tRNA nucleotidyltransferase/poly(A) polymerase